MTEQKKSFNSRLYYIFQNSSPYYFLKFRGQGARKQDLSFLKLTFGCIHTIVGKYLPTYLWLKATHWHLPCAGPCDRYNIPPSLKTLELGVWNSGVGSNCWVLIESKTWKKQQSSIELLTNAYSFENYFVLYTFSQHLTSNVWDLIKD